MSDWIKNLKVGDYVFVFWRGGRALKKVEKITPAGNIKVNGILFNDSGMERGGDTWSRSYLAEATQEEITSFRKELTIQRALRLMHETKEVTLEKALKIIEILEDKTE